MEAYYPTLHYPKASPKRDFLTILVYRWCKFTNDEHTQRGRFLGYRAVLEALGKAITNSETIPVKDKLKMVKLKRRGLTKGQMRDYTTFKENALTRFDFGLPKQEACKAYLETTLDLLHEQYETQFILFECIVGLQNFVQEILEGFVTLDRVVYLREKGLYPKIFKIFDEDISPRNTVIYCIKE